jgi:hypothetical protein
MEQVVQSRETTGMQKARPMKVFPDNLPEFQIILYKANKKATYLVVMQMDKNNVGILTKILQKSSKENALEFFPWREYNEDNCSKKSELFIPNKKVECIVQKYCSKRIQQQQRQCSNANGRL